METVEAGPGTVRRITPSGCERRPGRSNGGQRSWSLAAGGLACAQHRIAQSPPRLARDSTIDCEAYRLTRRTAGCGPACPVVWEGRSCEAHPYPNSGSLVAIANDHASASGREAAQLRKEAEAERLARVELEQSIAWRRLNQETRDKLASKLRHFSVARSWLLYNMNDVEAFNFGADLVLALKSATWNPTEPESLIKINEGPVPPGTNPALARGVVVSSTGEKANEEAADALVAAISSLGFDCTKSPRPVIREQHLSPTVFVMIEPRPEGPQGNAKLRAEAKKRQHPSSPSKKP